MKNPEHMTGKILGFSELEKLLTPEFRSAHRIVFTNGCFDLLHPSHIHYLTEAALMGDVLIIGLNSDASVRRLKGPGRPVNNEAARAIMLTALRQVDYVVVFDEDTPLRLIRMVRPDILVKGGDYKAADIVGYEEVIASGGRVLTVPFLEGYSSSSILDRMK